MSAKGTKSNSGDTPKRMKHGKEPTSVLLQVVWSAVETLSARGEARLFVGKDEVAILFPRTKKTEMGLEPLEDSHEKSVDN